MVDEMIEIIQLPSGNQVMSTSVETRVVKRGILILQFFLVVALGQALELGELKKKAEKGDKVAQFQLAFVYQNGGKTKDEIEDEIKWFKVTLRARELKIIQQARTVALESEVKEDLEKAIGLYRDSSNQGVVLSQAILGMLLGRHAEGDEAKNEESIEWLKKAAKKKSAIAQNGLGVSYEIGQGLPKDPKKAREWFLKAAEQGYAVAQSNLAQHYMLGSGANKFGIDKVVKVKIEELPDGGGIDFGEAVKWFRRAADQGYPFAKMNLGGLYLEGRGVEQNTQLGVSWTRKAAEADEPLAQFNMGWLYYDGKLVQQDYKTAYSWFSRSAENGWADGQLGVGKMLINGLGVEKDTSRGFKWVLQAAEKGNIDAQYHVSIYYLNGVGVEKDLGKSAKWSRAAAEKGHPEAQSIIGQLMFFGEGQKQDRQGAIRWLKMAAENGVAQSQFILGGCLFHGDGIEKDYAEAFKWLTLAGEYHEGARDELSKLNAEISPAQMVEGLKRVDEYKSARGGLR